MKGFLGLCLALACWAMLSAPAFALDGVQRQDIPEAQAHVQEEEEPAAAGAGYIFEDRMRAHFSRIAAERIPPAENGELGPSPAGGGFYLPAVADPHHTGEALLLTLPLQDRDLRFVLHSLRGAPGSFPEQDPGETGLFSLTGLRYSLDLASPLQFRGGLLHASRMEQSGLAEYQTWRADAGLAWHAEPATAQVWGAYSLIDMDASLREDPLRPLRSFAPEPETGAFSPASGPGGQSLASQLMHRNLDGETPERVWQIGFGVSGITYLDRWESSFGLAYGSGLYDEDLPEEYRQGLTRRDSFIEASAEQRYQAYENLAAVLELGYASLDLEEDEEERAYLMGLGVEYDFSF